jgi:hypothetical protein
MKTVILLSVWLEPGDRHGQQPVYGDYIQIRTDLTGTGWQQQLPSLTKKQLSVFSPVQYSYSYDVPYPTGYNTYSSEQDSSKTTLQYLAQTIAPLLSKNWQGDYRFILSDMLEPNWLFVHSLGGRVSANSTLLSSS